MIFPLFCEDLEVIGKSKTHNNHDQLTVLMTYVLVADKRQNNLIAGVPWVRTVSAGD